MGRDVQSGRDDESTYECFGCGHTTIDTGQPVSCPECGHEMRNRGTPME